MSFSGIEGSNIWDARRVNIGYNDPVIGPFSFRTWLGEFSNLLVYLFEKPFLRVMGEMRPVILGLEIPFAPPTFGCAWVRRLSFEIAISTAIASWPETCMSSTKNLESQRVCEMLEGMFVELSKVVTVRQISTPNQLVSN